MASPRTRESVEFLTPDRCERSEAHQQSLPFGRHTAIVDFKWILKGDQLKVHGVPVVYVRMAHRAWHGMYGTHGRARIGMACMSGLG